MKQLKIIIGDNTHNSKILIDDEPLGCVQDIRVHLSVDNITPEIEITFPQIDNYPIGWVEESLAKLADVPNVKIKYVKIG